MDPTTGERLYIWRRRAHMNQREFAVETGIARHILQALEGGADVDGLGVSAQSLADYLDVEPLTLAEKCVLARRRKREKVSMTAARLGVSRQWLNEMELGLADPTELARLWNLV